jgi:hypothetical protein
MYNYHLLHVISHFVYIVKVWLLSQVIEFAAVSLMGSEMNTRLSLESALVTAGESLLT